MTAVEEIQAAIEKLTTLQLEATRAPWSSEEDAGGSLLWPVLGGYSDGGEGLMSLEDADLIVTLHRTIDAQLAILAGAIPGAQLNAACGTQTTGPILALARAINGTDPEPEHEVCS